MKCNRPLHLSSLVPPDTGIDFHVVPKCQAYLSMHFSLALANSDCVLK